MAEISAIRPQPGPQENFLSSPADIAIYGGAAGGGKSFSLLLEPTRHLHNPRFGGVIFRRNATDVLKEGGLWDESQGLYSLLGGISRENVIDWKFPAGSSISMSHIEHEKTKLNWQGAQIPFLGFDEITHFTASMFWYMLSRNRSTCGIRPYVRGTCNPDPDSFVAPLIAWYIGDDGYAIPERSGVLRYFLKFGDDIVWAMNPQELLDKYPATDPRHIKSFTFISSNIYDNKILLEKDPGYLGNLLAQNTVDCERLLKGNWKIRPSAGMYFRRGMFPLVDAAPQGCDTVRSWDLAGTEADKDANVNPDWTVGLKLSMDSSRQFYVEHVERFQAEPDRVERSIVNIAVSDGKGIRVRIPQDPGQAGKSQAKYLIRQLAGYDVKSERETGDKITRAKPASAQAGAGNIKVVRGHWNEAFFNELENFPSKGSPDDQVDALSGALNMLVSNAAEARIRSL